MDRFIAGVCEPFPNQKSGQISFRFRERVAQRVAQMQALINRRVQGKIHQLIAGKYVSLGNQSRTDCLMHHGVQQNNVIGFKGYHW